MSKYILTLFLGFVFLSCSSDENSVSEKDKQKNGESVNNYEIATDYKSLVSLNKKRIEVEKTRMDATMEYEKQLRLIQKEFEESSKAILNEYGSGYHAEQNLRSRLSEEKNQKAIDHYVSYLKLKRNREISMEEIQAERTASNKLVNNYNWALNQSQDLSKYYIDSKKAENDIKILRDEINAEVNDLETSYHKEFEKWRKTNGGRNPFRNYSPREEYTESESKSGYSRKYESDYGY